MSIALAIALYIVIWWTLLFAVLPWGIRTQGEVGEIVPGTPASAPDKTRLLRVFAINTVMSALVLAVVWLVITRGWIDFSRMPSPV